MEKNFSQVIKDHDHNHKTVKYRGSAHSHYNINLKLIRKAPVLFHNLGGYDHYLIMQEINKFDVEISATPNGLDKYMAFIINENLVFIDSMQFMNSTLDILVKNLPDNDFKYFTRI